MRKPCTVQAGWAEPSNLALVVMFGFGIGAAQAQAAPANSPPRTVTWYADNPQARARVELACLDDPGHLMRNPDCVNAHKASVETALRSTRLRTGTMNPRDPAFWSNDPNNRKSKLLMCSRNPELDYCDVARRSLMIEAGQVRR